MLGAKSLIKAKTLRDEIIEALQRAIIFGELQPGQPLIERDLVAQFGVSSIPIREALQELESRGLVTKRPNYSCCVIALTPEELQQMFELRALLEPPVIAWAGARMSASEAATLPPLLEALRRAAAQNDFAQFFYYDLQLHRRLWELSGNRIAAQALERAVLPLFAFGLMRDHRAEELNLPQEVAKHERMITALCKGQATRAARVLGNIATGFETHVQAGGKHGRRKVAARKRTTR